MSIGRHARKRAAQQAEQAAITQNQLLGEQQALLKKEEAKKTAMEKETEGQRIATMRARFGGQVPEQTTGGGGGGGRNTGEKFQQLKNKSPYSLNNQPGLSKDPMQQTIMSMMLGGKNNRDGVL